MRDEVFKEFIDDFLDKKFEEKDYKQHINLFSKFLSYTNSDYKYNSTYLTQFINDYINIREWLKKKMECYVKILMELDASRHQYILLLDQFHYSHNLIKEKNGKVLEERETHYEKIEKNKIMSKKIEVKVTIILDDKEYMISKVYDNFEEHELEKTIYKNIEDYIQSKEKENSLE